MKKVVTRLVLVISFMFTSMANANMILSLDPGTQIVEDGDIVSVTLMIDGLGNFDPLSLSAFDITLAFDSSALSFVSYNLFDGLSLGIFDSDDLSGGLVAPGFINIAEFSYLFDFELWNFQPGSFALAELFFVADTVGTSAISFAAALLTDAGGNADPINITQANNASVTAVPTPATSMLMCLGLLTMFVRQKYHSSGINKS